VHSEQVEAFERILALHGPTGLAKITNATTAKNYFKDFLYRVEVDLSTRDGDKILAAFAAFLCKDGGFFKLDSSLRAYKRAIKKILRAAEFSFADPKKAPVFNATIENWIVTLKNETLKIKIDDDSSSPAPKRKLRERAKETRENAHRVKPATWEKTERNLRVYLGWWRERPNVSLETIQDALSLLSLDCFQDFTDHADEINRYTGSGVETIVDCLSRALRMSVRSHPSLINAEDAVERKRSLWHYNYDIKPHLKKPGVEFRIQEKGGAPKHYLLFKGFKHSLHEILPGVARDHVLAEWCEKEGNFAQAEKIRYRIAVRVFDLAIMAVWHTFANRPEDLHHRLLAAQVCRYQKTEGDVFVLGYQPSKTEGNANPSEVEASLAPWFSDLFDYYLTDCRDRLYPGSTCLFPAQKVMKEKYRQFAHPDEMRRGNLAEWAQRKSYKYFGIALSANEMRKSLATFFEAEELMGLHRFMGHWMGHEKQKREQNFTQVARGFYIIDAVTHDIVRKDTHLYQRIAELYKTHDIDVTEIPKLADLIEVERKKLVARLAKKKSAA
ncbi:MAG: hypothetical protein P4M08_12360, partial [Oligoflexia bacterium]|nr:hypothetical protein [Oligoflexia bacterium]